MVMRHPASQSGTSPCLLVSVEFNIYMYCCTICCTLVMLRRCCLGYAEELNAPYLSYFCCTHPHHRRLLSSEDMAASYSDNGKRRATADNSAVMTSKALAPATKMHVRMLKKCRSAW